MRSTRPLRAVIALSILLAASRAPAGMGEQGLSLQGLSLQGLSLQGLSLQGLSLQGLSLQGLSLQGLSLQGLSLQGLSLQGLSLQGLSLQGLSLQGLSLQGLSLQGLSLQGLSLQGLSLQGLSLQGRGMDRARGLIASLVLQNVELVAIPSVDIQGIQSISAPITYQAGPSGARLQASPGDTKPGSYIQVPGLPATESALEGTLWNLAFKDAAGDEGRVPLFIADVERDDDVYLYTVYFRQPATGQWVSLCPTDSSGKALAMATPLDPSDWSSEASRARFAFACVASGVAAKCARNWGYRPWLPERAPFYNACLIAARADYCQDNQSFTRDGTLVDLFDVIPTDGEPAAINPTVGLSVDPYTTRPMLHEEYQISVAGRVIDVLQPWEIDYLSDDDRALVTRLHRSGLQSSRYPDLDPGRSCAAAPFIDRCTSAGPLACQRAANMESLPYGAFIAVNSPRHCTHAENEIGEPMIPACSTCTSRVCAIDPSCCGDPGADVFPASLVWDGRCTALRQEVCRSTPVGSGTEANVWPAGVVATGGVKLPALLRGALGAFQGIVTDGSGVQFAEGWACDPDFPLASSPIQIAVGGVLGAAGTTLVTATADQPLAPGWREIAAAECGGGGRHGFRVALPAASAGREVFVYGIDLNVPGAPFSLLRGGNKRAPDGSAAPSPRAAIFTGWVEPTVSGQHLFAVDAGSDDKFRLWVNGVFVAGNWKDPVTTPSTPDAFTLDPPSPPPTPFLQKGIRYALRLEYLRGDTATAGSPASHLAVTWSVPTDNPSLPSLPPQPIPTAALYAMAQSAGSGLQGTYFPGVTSLDALPPDSDSTLSRTFGAVDHVWNDGNPPIAGRDNPAIPGLSVGDSFGARFEGQLVPPISGNYTFSLDTDGAARIVVNGQQVATVTQRSDAPEAQCAHDICVTGAAISHACQQENFCAAFICQADPACCSQTWDARCVDEVRTDCAVDVCTPTQAASVALHAGWKYDVRVEYQHRGSTPDAAVRGAKLKLMWSLPGTPRDVIPAARLFAATAPPAAQLGTGINAAYFFDAKFRQEVLDRVEATLGFDAASPPGAALSDSLICGAPGAPPCALAPAPGAPALTAARTFQAAPGTMAVTLTGGGAVPGATLTVFERTPAGTIVALGSPDIATTTTGGAFTTTPLTVARRRYVLVATQSLGGQASAPSEELVVNVTDPDAPPPPAVTQPVSGATGADGTVPVGGTAAPNASVTVTATVPGAPGSFTTVTFSADGNGSWTGAVTLPPGSYDLTFTQTSAGHTSEAGAAVNVKVPVPALDVTAPADGQSVTCPTRTCLVAVSGSGASPGLGPIVVADGDGRFFVDLPTEPQPLAPAADGSFSGQLALDHGRHQLKIFQRANGLDGVAVPRTVLVRPATGAIVVQTPIDGAIINPNITVRGDGPPRQGLPSAVAVYQLPRGIDTCPVTAGPPGPDAIRLGEGTLDQVTGAFAVRVNVGGVGRQCLAVSSAASSLSGAGAADGELSPAITVRVPPPAPFFTRPARSGTTEPGSLGVDVEGIVAPGASVTIFAERPGAATASVTAPAPNGTFAAAFPELPPGTYRLTATATVDGAESARSDPAVVITIGDVTPPTLKVADPADSTRQPVRTIPVTATNASGASFDFAPWVSAVDPAADGGDGAPLDAGRIVCEPAAGPSVPRFPLGATTVSCAVTDLAGNRGSTTFIVSVRSNERPSITGSNLTAEAQGPAGAAVNYQIAASGFAGDCAAPGSGAAQSCSQWRPASTGLGINPTALAMDEATGDFYIGVLGLQGARLLRSTNGGATWQELAAPGVRRIAQIVVASGSPATLYVSGIFFDDRLKISRDGGQSWVTSLENLRSPELAQDPRDAAHLLAWFRASLFETRDAGVTWEPANAGLPDVAIDAVAIDRLNADRMYLSLDVPEGFFSGKRLVRLFRRTDGGPWQEQRIFPFDSVFGNRAGEIFVAPWSGPCATGSPFPTVFAGTVYSCDGGDSWQEIEVLASQAVGFGFARMAFDRNVPGRIYATHLALDLVSQLFTSSDHGRSWTAVRTPDPIILNLSTGSLVQDPSGRLLYAAHEARGFMRSEDGGQSWLSVVGDLPVARLSVSDLAGDPVDPAIAHIALADSGVYQTRNAGATWERRSELLNVADRGFRADRVVVHPLARNVLFTGGVGVTALGGMTRQSWATSADTGATWTGMLDGNGFSLEAVELAPDPFDANGWLVFSGAGDGSYLYWQSGFANLPLDSNEMAFNLQRVPDAAQTAVVSIAGGCCRNPTMLVSFRELVDTGFPSTIVDPGLMGPANVVYDGSDGTHRLFVSGKALGQDPNLLYRATVDDVLAGLPPDGWEPLVGDGAFPGFQLAHEGLPTRQDAFSTLIIDPVSGGQTMYTLASGNTLWESRDGGRSWRRDDTAPGFVTAAWLSPVDGALYTTVSPSFTDTADRFWWGTIQMQVDAPGQLWKRAPRDGILPGTTVARGDVRVTCAGPPGFAGAVTPGATFPIGRTVLSCSATDVFGNVGSASFRVTVRDTTPPVLVVPPDVTLTGGCAPPQSIGTATATDLASPPVTISSNRPAVFRPGITVVTYTARDARGNTATGKQRVTVRPGDDSACCPPRRTKR